MTSARKSLRLSEMGAGATATAAMGAVMLATHHLGWMGEMPPQKTSRKALRRLHLRRSASARSTASAVNRFGYGMAGGVAFGWLKRKALFFFPSPIAGILFGLGIWVASYLGWVPSAGIINTAYRDKPGRTGSMILAHLVYGAALGLLTPQVNQMVVREQLELPRKKSSNLERRSSQIQAMPRTRSH